MPRNMGRNTGLSAHAGLQRARESAIRPAARRAAATLAAQGQRGDRRLIHVDDQVLDAVRAAYGPSGLAGSRNPITGLEQFAPEGDVTGTNNARLDSPASSWNGADDGTADPSALSAAFNILTGIKPREEAIDSPLQLAQLMFPRFFFLEEPPYVARPPTPLPPRTRTDQPAPDVMWKGKPGTKPGDPQGSWHNPRTDEVFRPDLDHPPPIGPHWDWRAPDGNWYRWFLDGRVERNPNK